MLLSKYENMLDALDLNNLAKARQLTYSLLSLPTINYKNLAIIPLLLLRIFCAAV